MPSDLHSLAARAEALDGRNNGGDMTLLTSEIARALGWVRVTPSEARNKTGHWVAPEDCRNGKPVYDSLHGTEVHRTPPLWLWSLDAALTLVPEGWQVAALEQNWRTGLWRAQLIPVPSATLIAAFDRGETVGWNTADAPDSGTGGIVTPALALVAACLRARATQGENDG
jgi:hypothetical protein